MERELVKRVPDGSSFWFGDVEFVKLKGNENSRQVFCQIKGKEAYVYIAGLALVEVKKQ